jgi:dihydropteroate synthase
MRRLTCRGQESYLPTMSIVATDRVDRPTSYAGLSLERPLLMGIINTTPDSFSDGGLLADDATAIRRGMTLAEDGADIIDVGGESTRPGSAPVDIAEEWRRVGNVIAALVRAGIVVSVDTRHAEIMRRALDAGARIINDVTALTGDAASLAVAAASDASIALMHMQGEPATMQKNPRYDDVVGEVETYLAARIAACEAAGIARARIAVDPGIGFGKTVAHNVALLAACGRLRQLGAVVLIGASRKSFIAKLSRGEVTEDRVGGSIAAALASAARGADILRVHDVAATRQALDVWRAIEGR